MPKEGPYTKISAVAAVLALVLGYLGAAASVHWWPFAEAHPAGGGTSAAFASPVTNHATPSETEDLAGFVTGYYHLLPDTNAGWALVGPDLRQRGRAGYDRFWGGYTGVDVLEPPWVRDRQVTVRLALHPRAGTGTQVERHVLTVIRYDGGLRIDADEYLGRG
ncbi:hypothetical protein GCM10027258_26540 [Amycolatopsis stemonae]